MSVVIYLSNRDVKAVVGTEQGGQAVATRTCRAQAPERSLINGMVTDEEGFTSFLQKFWEDSRLPKKDVTLVLGSSQAVTRMMEVPKMSHKKMMEYLPREFASVERAREPVYGYLQLSRESTLCRVFAVMVERSFLKPHVERFKKMGICLEGIAMAVMAEILALNQLGYLRDKTCVVQMSDGMSLQNILYVRGTCCQHTRSRISAAWGSEMPGMECAALIASQQQLLNAIMPGEVIGHVYLGGETGREDFSVWRANILQEDAGLCVEPVCEEPGGRLRLLDGEQGGFAHYITLIGGLLVPKGRGNLLDHYNRDQAYRKQYSDTIRYVMPPMAAFLVFGIISAAQGFTWFSRADQVKRQLDYMGSPELTANVAEYDRQLADHETLKRRTEVIRQTMENLNSYPQYDTRIRQAVQECAAWLATVEITSFVAAEGTLTLEASARDARSVHQFVDRLESRSDVFSGIYYEGFIYAEESNTWKTVVVCYLAGGSQTDGEARHDH